ncbi:MAG: hypothetical protein J2P21_22285 [Chloracidobacterium sp.]|nr:hypothetical protein [Chloracidobacterium sp.]
MLPFCLLALAAHTGVAMDRLARGNRLTPLVNARRDQRAADDLSAMTARTTATVREVSRVKEWILGG